MNESIVGMKYFQQRQEKYCVNCGHKFFYYENYCEKHHDCPECRHVTEIVDDVINSPEKNKISFIVNC